MKLFSAQIIISSLFAFLLISCASSGGMIGAQKRFNAGEYQSAINKIDLIILKYDYPDETLAQLYLLKAQSYEKLKQEVNARSTYQYIEKNFPNSSAYTVAFEKLL